MEQLQMEMVNARDEPVATYVVSDWCAYCFAAAEEGPVVNGRRYCSGAHAKRDTAKRDDPD